MAKRSVKGHLQCLRMRWMSLNLIAFFYFFFFFCLFFFFFFFLVFLPFLGPFLRHMEIPRLEV